jgi:hypothetical protein
MFNLYNFFSGFFKMRKMQLSYFEIDKIIGKGSLGKIL